MTSLTIVPMQPRHIPAVVGIHLTVLGETMNARLGRAHLSKLYRLCLEYPDLGCAWVALADDQSIIGFVSCTRDLLKLDRLIKRSLGLTGYLSILWFFLRSPSMVKKVFSHSAFANHLARRYPQPISSILTIGVNTITQHGGVGRQLVKQVDSYFRNLAIARYFVDTKTTNVGARRFYPRVGFHELGIIEGNALFEKTFT